MMTSTRMMMIAAKGPIGASGERFFPRSSMSSSSFSSSARGDSAESVSFPPSSVVFGGFFSMCVVYRAGVGPQAERQYIRSVDLSISELPLLKRKRPPQRGGPLWFLFSELLVVEFHGFFDGCDGIL